MVELVQWSNEQTLLGVMLETPQAIENLEKIMTVKDLHFVLFGLGDYSVRIGLVKPDKNYSKVLEAIKKLSVLVKDIKIYHDRSRLPLGRRS